MSIRERLSGNEASAVAMRQINPINGNSTILFNIC